MTRILMSCLSVIALLLLPLAGCSGSTNEGAGGTGATGGIAGGGGNGGAAGEGGSAGVGGMAGGGGTEATPPGLWTGSGVGGSAGSFDICFRVNEEGTALTQGTESGQPCEFFAWEVKVTGACVGGFAYKPDIPIVDGSFELVQPGSYELRGTFDGATASGEVTVIGVETCSSQWEATPSN